MSDSEEEYAFESADEGDGEPECKEKCQSQTFGNNSDTTLDSVPSENVQDGGNDSCVKDSSQTTHTGNVCETGDDELSTCNSKDEISDSTSDIKEQEDSDHGMVQSEARNSLENDASPEVLVESEQEVQAVKMNRTIEPEQDIGDDTGSDGKTRAAQDVRGALDKLTAFGSGKDDAQEASSSWGSWSSWGSSWGSTLLSTATGSVSTFTHQVEEGLNTVLETVEAGLTVPSPEEMAFEKKAERLKEHDAGSEEEEEEREKELEKIKKESDSSQQNLPSGSGSWLSGWGIAGITNVVQHTVSGGLDALETLGKKTIDVIQDTDPGLKKTKSIIRGKTGEKPNLSEVLRQAKNEAEQRAEVEKEFEEARKAHFGSLFDEYQGLAHLEALEMLSNQCEIKVQSYLTTMNTDSLQILKPKLIAIKEAFEVEDIDSDDENCEDIDFVKLITEYLSNLHVQASPDKLMKAHSSISETLLKLKEEQDAGERKEGKDIHQKAIQALAELTSKAVEQFHKAGELILLKKEESLNIYEERAKNIANLTRTICSEVGCTSSKFTDCLNTAADDSEDPDSITPLITNVYLEATNSSTYVQEAFQLLLSVLQLSTIESFMS